MQSNPYKTIPRLLTKHGLVVLHTGQAPLNPVNLFDSLIALGERVRIEVDDGFIEAMRKLADEPRS